MDKIRAVNISKLFGTQPERALPLLAQGANKAEIVAQTGLAVGLLNVSFEVKAGEIFVIMGLSGCGKSTLIRCLNRLIEPTSGQLFINDGDVLKLGNADLLQLRRHKLGMVFQQFALFPHRSILRNVEYGLEIQQVPKPESEARARQALKLVGLEAWEQAKPSQLSGGMQQRVGLARALAIEPEVLLMDEAFSALDPLIRRDMQSELINLQTQMHKTILFITHDLDEALRLGDRIALMKDGAIVQIGTPQEILENPADAFVQRFVSTLDRTRH